VSDLRVEQLNSTVKISFTAPGEDEDMGTGILTITVFGQGRLKGEVSLYN